MKRFFRPLFLSTLTCLSLSPGIVSLPAQAQEATPLNAYPPAVVEDYLQACQSKATEAGVPAGVVQTFCHCTLNKLQSRYNIAEFQRLRDQASTGETTPAAFKEVGMACFGELSGLSLSLVSH